MFFIILCGLIVFSEGLKRPDYIKPCSKGPNFDKCAVESAKYAIPLLAKGDKMFKIPNLMPLKIPLVELSAGNAFKLKIKNMEIHGLETMQPIKFSTDFEKKIGMSLTHADKLVILGDYEINGKISIIPVEGQGPLNITLVGGDYIYMYSWDLVKKNGVDYINNVGGEFDYTITKAYYNLENLFGEDKVLGAHLNMFLNENWQTVSKDMKKSITKTIEVIYEDISRKIYTKIPYNELFLS